MKKLLLSGLLVMMAMVLICGLLTACVQPPVGGQTESTTPPTENTAPIESVNPLEAADPLESTKPIESSAPVENTEKPVSSISAEDLVLSEDGRLASNSANAVNLQAMLDGYLAARIAAINEPDAAAPASADGGDAAAEDAILRAKALREFWENEGIYIVSVEASCEIREIAAGELPGTVDLALNELTWVDYNNVGVDAPAGDRFSYGNDHEMTVSMNSDGTFSILKDSYEELDVSGHASADYDGTGACAAWE